MPYGTAPTTQVRPAGEENLFSATVTISIPTLTPSVGSNTADVLAGYRVVSALLALVCLTACRAPDVSPGFPVGVERAMDAADEALGDCSSWTEEDNVQGSASLRRFVCETDPTSARSNLRISTFASDEEAASWVAFSQMLDMCQRLMTSADLPTLDDQELLLGDLTVQGRESDLIKVKEVLGGAVFTRRDPFPPEAKLIDSPDPSICGGVEIQPASWDSYRSKFESLDGADATEAEESSPTPTTPAFPSRTPSEAPPSAGAAKDECVEDCAWGVDDVMADLSQVLCTSRDGWATLSDEPTDPPLAIRADVVRACTAGGSASYLGFGVVFAWEEYSGLQAAMQELDDCATSGLTFVGGAPNHPGYAIITHDGDPLTVTALLDAGARQVCP
jgi:hypothetical protein